MTKSISETILESISLQYIIITIIICTTLRRLWNVIIGGVNSWHFLVLLLKEYERQELFDDFFTKLGFTVFAAQIKNSPQIYNSYVFVYQGREIIF
jgi:hypothetical protein